ncbi:MAG: hypothetical protein M3Q69_10110 [Acidobacteriota bacterium]|nr:hypothetical protein [Acidobacteriota bacterium]
MIYRKRGVVVRYENGTRIAVRECGIAREEGELFACEPDRDDAPPLEVPEFEPPQFALPATVAIERSLFMHGVAEHQYGETRWREETRRLHLSLTRDRMRVLIDQGPFDRDEIERIATALANAESEREPPPRLRLAPNVAAALLPSLAGIAPSNVRLVQTAGGFDGYGNAIVEAEREWPNWYRPSYRVRPVRMPLNLRLECDVTTIDEDRPIAIALLAPVAGLAMRVLVEDGAHVYPSTVRVTRIDAVAREWRWYPYGAGSFGAAMML